MTAPITVDDRELIERLERESRTVFPERMRDGHSYHSTANALDLAADRLQSLLSDRDKLEQLLERVWACRVEVQGRFVNLEKLWPVIDDIGVVLSQREVS